MKVLRTALMSAFMMLYFVNTGHAQLNPPTGQIAMTIRGMSMTPLEDGQVLVEYAIFQAPPNSVTTVKYEGLMPLYTEVVSGTVQVSAIVTVDTKENPDQVELNCEVCKEDGSECRVEGGVVVVNP